MLRYSMSFAVSFIAAVAAVAVANFAIDADGLYHEPAQFGEFTRAYVDQLLRSTDGLVLIRRERSIKLELAHRGTADCMVTGSSHEMQLDLRSAPQIFDGCRSVVNLAVMGGGFEDFIAATGVILGREVPVTVYVGVDPWTLRPRFNPRFTQERGAYDHARTILGLKKDPAGRTEGVWWYLNLVGADYLLHNVESMRRAARHAIKDGRLATDDEGVIESDGTILMPRSMLRRLPLSIPTTIPGMSESSSAVDSAVAFEFERALTLMIERHFGVKLLLMPYHPETMSCTRAYACETLSMVETYARHLGRRLGVDVIGSFDPRPFALTTRDFKDVGHLQLQAFRNVRQLSNNPWTREGTTSGPPP
jgi:hypothetical protein